MRLGDSENETIRTCVREMLDKAVRISADIVHTSMGLLQAPKPRNALQLEYCQQLLAMFLGGHPNHQLVLMRIGRSSRHTLRQRSESFMTKTL